MKGGEARYSRGWGDGPVHRYMDLRLHGPGPERAEGGAAHVPLLPPPSWTTGGLMIDYPGICKKMGWDASKLCGPWLCALRAEDPAECCPYKHPKGSALHGNRPSAEGKPFMMAD